MTTLKCNRKICLVIVKSNLFNLSTFFRLQAKSKIFEKKRNRKCITMCAKHSHYNNKGNQYKMCIISDNINSEPRI